MIFLFLALLLIFSNPVFAYQPERPVVLVHGIGFKGIRAWQSASILQYLGIKDKGMANFLEESGGYTLGKNLFIYEYDAMVPIEHIASELSLAIEEYMKLAHADNVDLVCFSMGGLVARTMLNGQTNPPVVNLITIATPHKGSYWVGVAESLKPQPEDWLFRTLGELRDRVGTDYYSLEIYRFIDSIYRFGEYPSIQQMAPDGDFVQKIESFYLSPKINVTCIAGYVLPAFDSAFIPESFVNLITDRFGPGDLVVPLHSAIWERANQIFVVKGRPDITWHSVLPYHPEVQAIVKHTLSRNYMFERLESFN